LSKSIIWSADRLVKPAFLRRIASHDKLDLSEVLSPFAMDFPRVLPIMAVGPECCAARDALLRAALAQRAREFGARGAFSFAAHTGNIRISRRMRIPERTGMLRNSR
jgi:hypothetical protein